MGYEARSQADINQAVSYYADTAETQIGEAEPCSSP